MSRSRREQLADDLDRFLEHLEPLVGPRPAVAEHMLVEILARADAEEEASIQQHLCRRGGVGDDRGMDADQRARNSGPDPDRVVDWPIAPITPQTNGLWPCASTQG